MPGREGDSPVHAHVRTLDQALAGPARAKADLLAEARDALVDAAESYERRGLSRHEAERRAVDDFGSVADVGPHYQAELGLAQSRRTGLLLFGALLLQPLVWDRVWPLVADNATASSGPAQTALDRATEMAGGVAMLGALVAVAIAGFGVRYLGVRRRLTRVVGRAALGASAYFAVSSLVMAAQAPDAMSSLALRVGWATVFVVLPLVPVVVSARRCLRYA